MAEADIIPLGTRGAPGRGSRAASPSKAARTLAPAAKGRKRRPKGGLRAAGTPEQEAVENAAAETAADVAAAEAAPGQDDLTTGVADDIAAGLVDDSTVGPGTDPAGDADAPQPDEPTHTRSADEEQPAGAPDPRLDPVARSLAFLRRRITGDYEVDEFGFDADLTSAVLMRLLRPLAEKWFRIEVRGLENVPAEGGALLVSNHSGTIPLDALMTSLVVHDHAGRYLRALGADLVFTMPFVSELARKGGATLACGDDAERMLADGELVGVWPEGFKGVGKPYSERYKLQRFGRGGFVSAAIRTGVPIVPCSVVGAEEIYPLIANVPTLARLLKLPYVPVTPTFPWLGLLGLVPLPSKWVIEFGEPISTDDFVEGAADDPMLVFDLTDQVRETIQQSLYTLLVQRKHVFY